MSRSNSEQLRILLLIGGLVVAIAILVGSILGQPILFAYVTSGSMEPTIAEGDGFIAIPAEVSGSTETGDVIVYEQEGSADAALTTHRVVDVTDHGYVTKGDANFLTDQDGGEPYVTDGQVVATALQINGHVVTIPKLGSAVMWVQSGFEAVEHRITTLSGFSPIAGSSPLTTTLFVLGVIAIGASLYYGRRDNEKGTPVRKRSRSFVFDPRRIVLVIGLLICLVSAGTMLAMADSTQIGIVSSEYDSGAPHVIPAGEERNSTYEVQYDGVVPVITVFEPASDGIAVDSEPTRLHRGESANVTVDMTAPDETGYYLRSFSTYRYFSVLPAPLVVWLHSIHPWLAIVAVSTVLTVPVMLVFAFVLGSTTIRTRRRRKSKRRSRLTEFLN